uniref:photosystem I assembly protein Ycf4 n=1 Tax=Tanaecium tetramerum TaxID=1971366 RepID=UPI0028D40929|nr:photosystem I assembly protein Ycf4 [Tanaecium tetramerum]WMU99909.1 photosystem I assembly protein Ycf4 [Tanaecium tetramerum]
MTGARKLSNFFWALTVFLGSLGFLLAGISSYLGKNLISFVSSEQVPFFPQGIVMVFYGIAGFFISLYLWSTISLNVGSGYDRFDKKKGIVCIFRWGFPGKNRRIVLQFDIKDIQCISMRVKKGPYGRRLVSIDMIGRGVLVLTHTDENLNPLEQEVVELALFLRVPIKKDL